MAAYQQINNYLHNHYEGMNPKQLILLLYNGALSRLKLTREGIEANDVKKRGENLSKAIAIISELNASVDSKMDDESTQFLRGLYTAILTELPKVSLTNDIKTLERAEAYISGLKDIWEKEVMHKKESKPEIEKKSEQKRSLISICKQNNPENKFHSISV